jgi:hypothetical protein
MSCVVVRPHDFVADRQGKTFADVVNDPDQPLKEVLEFLSDEARQRRMEEAEIHHDRPPMAGVVRELESQPAISAFFSLQSPHRSKRLRQAIGVVVRMIMERRGWKKTGKKGSLGVRASRKADASGTNHNTGGLAFWFLRAERYKRQDGMPFPSVRERMRKLAPSPSPQEASAT